VNSQRSSDAIAEMSRLDIVDCYIYGFLAEGKWTLIDDSNLRCWRWSEGARCIAPELILHGIHKIRSQEETYI
jgi:hypothetical protein